MPKFLRVIAGIIAPLLATLPASAQSTDLRAAVAGIIGKEFADLSELYKHLHANPELSLREEKTAARIAGELSRAEATQEKVMQLATGGH